MFDTMTVLIVAATFLAAGAVKGVIGLGLPTVSLAVLTVALGLPEAMNLLLVPSVATNLWQACVGGNAVAILRRLWPFLLMAVATVWIGAGALTRVDLSLLSGMLGALLIFYAAISLSGLRIAVGARQERWAGPAFGAVNGVLTGMTGSFVVPGVMYLQAIGLPRDMLIQAMGALFTLSTLALAVGLTGSGLFSVELGALSVAALVPAALGMAAGQWIRRRLSEDWFRRVFFVALLALGAYIVFTAFKGGAQA